MARRVPKFIPLAERARVFLALARMLEAGLPAARALAGAADGAGAATARRLELAATAAGRGAPLVRTLERQGLLSPLERALLNAAEAGGALAGACALLADRSERAHRRGRRMAGRMLLPALVLALGLLVAPFPAFYEGEIGAGGYLLRVLLPALGLGAACLAARGAARRWSGLGAPASVAALARRLPVARVLAERTVRAGVLEDLYLLARSGVPAIEALGTIAGARRATASGARVTAARRSVERGASVADALRDAALVDAAGYALLGAGEAAGRLDESLGRVATVEREALDEIWDSIGAWTPRVAYALVCGWMVAGLLA